MCVVKLLQLSRKLVPFSWTLTDFDLAHTDERLRRELESFHLFQKYHTP